MARIRTIKPEFWKHEELSALPEPTHLLAAALLNYADDFGYFNANPGLVKAECSPLREPSVNIRESLASLSEVGYLAFGSTPDGKRYGRIVTFSDHQRVDHPSKSRISGLSITWDSLAKSSGDSRETLAPEQGTGNREQGREQGTPLAPSPSGSTPDVPRGPAFIDLPTNTGKPWSVYPELVADWKQLFPAVDVEQQLRAMRAWLDANPKNRKTFDGMKRFAVHWLGRDQNRTRSARNGESVATPDYSQLRD